MQAPGENPVYFVDDSWTQLALCVKQTQSPARTFTLMPMTRP